MTRSGWQGFLAASVWAAAVLLAVPAAGQALDAQKGAVVKITAQKDGRTRTGTGFIIKVEPDSVYIATAAHVVEGDPAPSVEFFTARNRRVKSDLIRAETDQDKKGIALLTVRGKDNIPPRVTALTFDRDADLEGGEAVTTIGFGLGQGDWAVLRMQVISVDGRDLKLDGRIEEGNSGGPVLRDGKVVGLITSQKGIGLATPVQFVAFVLKTWGMDVSEGRTRSAEKAPADGTVGDGDLPAGADSRKEAPERSSRPAAAASAPSPSNIAATGQLAWQDHSLRFEGTVREDTAVPVLQAHVFDLLTGTKIGVFDAPIAADLSRAPAFVILSASFSIPSDSVTPQPHMHISNLHFEVRADNRAALVQNCDLLGCYPASGSLPLD